MSRVVLQLLMELEFEGTLSTTWLAFNLFCMSNGLIKKEPYTLSAPGKHESGDQSNCHIHIFLLEVVHYLPLHPFKNIFHTHKLPFIFICCFALVGRILLDILKVGLVFALFVAFG